MPDPRGSVREGRAVVVEVEPAVVAIEVSAVVDVLGAREPPETCSAPVVRFVALVVSDSASVVMELEAVLA